MKKVLLFCVLVMLFFVVLNLNGQDEFQVKYAGGFLEIDGKGTESVWKETEKRSFDNFYNVEKETDRQKTLLRMLWDEDNLYLLFECEDQFITARETERNGQPYFDDCAEIFLIPVPEAVNMHMGFELNLYKASNDFIFINSIYEGQNAVIKSYDPEFLVEIAVDGTINDSSDIDRGWSMEMAIPLDLFLGLEKFSPVIAGNRWTFMAVRQDRNDAEGNRRSTSTIFPLPSPRENVHDPLAFGQMLFVK